MNSEQYYDPPIVIYAEAMYKAAEAVIARWSDDKAVYASEIHELARAAKMWKEWREYGD